MDTNLCSLDLNILQALYEQETYDLRRALINGVQWEELKDQRKNVTELAIAIHKKIHAGTSHPAENSLRRDTETA